MQTINVEGHEVIPTLATQGEHVNLYDIHSDGELAGYVITDKRGNARQLLTPDAYSLRLYSKPDGTAPEYLPGLYMASRALVILTDPAHAERCDSSCEVHGNFTVHA